MQRKNISFLIAIVVILGAVIAYLLFPKGPKPIPDPLAKYSSLEESRRLSDERRKLAAEYEKKVAEYFAGGAAREKALREELSKANAEQKKVLEQEIAALRSRLESFAGQLNTWRERVEASPEPSDSNPAAPKENFPPPPAPPPPGEPATDPSADQATKEKEEQRAKEEAKQMAAVLGAALCVAQPEICPFVPIIVAILGELGSSEGGRQVLDVLQKAQQGIPADPATIQKASEFVNKHPDLEEALSGMSDELQDEARNEIARQLERILPLDVSAGQWMEYLKNGASCDMVKSFFSKCGDRPCFVSPAQKEVVRRAVEQRGADDYEKYWTRCLESVEVRQ